MPRLSIIIPLLGDSKKLDDTLVSVLENRPAHCEILVVHNEPYDDPYQLSSEVCFIEAPRGADFGECLNLGLSESRSPLIHVLTCGVEVCAGWAHTAMRRFRDPGVVAVASAVVRHDDRSLVVSAGLGYRVKGAVRRLALGDGLAGVAARGESPHGPDLLAAFFRKSTLEAMGGFPSWAGDEFVGVDLALALHRAGCRCALEPNSVTHVDPRIVAERASFTRGRDAERLFWRWASQSGWKRSLVGHAAMLAGECLASLLRPMMITQFMGRVWGAQVAVQGNRYRLPSMDSASPAILPGPHLAAANDRPRSRQATRVA